MRIAGLVFSSIVTFSVAAGVLTYVPGYVGQQRIYVRGHHGNTHPDSARSVAVHQSDSTLQRYYSESEGWTYYTLPAYSVAGGER
jgi:hypothetical protein